MSVSSFIRGLLAGYGVAIPLGPITLLIMEMGIQHGFRTALSGSAGAATADLMYATLAVFAGIFIARLLAPFSTPLHYLSGAALILIGLWLLNTQRKRNAGDLDITKLARRTNLQAFTMILGLTLLNPVTITYFTALILGLNTSERHMFADEWFFVAGVFLASFSWQILLAGTGSFVGRRVSPRTRTMTQIAGSLLIVGLGTAVLIGLY